MTNSLGRLSSVPPSKMHESNDKVAMALGRGPNHLSRSPPIPKSVKRLLERSQAVSPSASHASRSTGKGDSMNLLQATLFPQPLFYPNDE